MTRSKMRQIANQLWKTAQGSAVAVSAVLLIAAVAFRLHFSFITVSFSFLLVLVLQSLRGDFASSAIASVVAVGCLDYLFVDPLFSFRVNSPLYTVGLASFLVTSLVITRLVTKVRIRTKISELHEKRLQGLYDLAQHLLALEPTTRNGNQILQPFCGALGIRGICLFDGVDSELYMCGDADTDLEKKTVQAFIHSADLEDGKKSLAIRCIRVGSRTIGSIGFLGIENPDQTAGPLATLAATQLERRHSMIHASQAVAAVQTESHRTAILDALAHEFKTPLATILTAAGALREAPSLGPQHREMTEIVESEAARLGRLTSRLIRTARLEREEVKPWIELIDVHAVSSDIVDRYVRTSEERIISVVKDCDSTEAMADPELLRLVVSQLLDNALKYSSPRSTITLRISREDDQIAIRVHSSGNPIPAEERGKIFDRFYRGVDGRRSGPGSGLGLFVARKIVTALGGSIDLEGDNAANSNGAVFRLTLPIPEGEREHHDVAAAV